MGFKLIDKEQSSLFSNDITESIEAMDLIIMGEPKAQKRHRSVKMEKRVGDKIHTMVRQYDPSQSDKGDFLSILQKNAPGKPFDCPIKLDIKLFFTRPKSHYRTGKNAHVLKDNPKTWHVSKPDTDNCVKFIMDALNKIFWRDDSLICNISITKMYDQSPRTEIKVISLCY